MSYIQLPEHLSSPSNPPSGKHKIFIGPNGAAHKKSDGTVELFKSIFGTSLLSKKKTDNLVNATTTEQTYDTLSLSNMPQSNYLVFIRWVWGYASGSNDIRVQWYLDSSPLIEEHRQEPKDGGSDQRLHNQSFTIVQLDGNHDISVSYRASSGGNQARMYESEILVFRI